MRWNPSRLVISGIGLVAAAGAAVPLPAALAPAAWIAAFWIPGAAFVARHELPRPGRWRLDGLWIPLVLGPVVFGAGISLGRLAGLPLDVAAAATVLVSTAMLAARFSPPPLEAVTSPPTPRRVPYGPLLVGIAVVALAAWPLLAQPALRVRDDARLHLPIVDRLLSGSFPPENPFLAGEPLSYFWFHHVTIAGLASLVRAPIDLLASLLDLHALAGLLLALDATGRALRVSAPARAATLALFTFGLAPWGWIRLLWMQHSHPDLNWALFRATGVAALFPMLSPTEPRLAAFLTKIAITNALPMSLALAALAALPLPPAGPLGHARRAAAAAGALHVHVATGILLLAGLGLVELTRLGRGVTKRGWPLAGLAWLAGAGGVSLPYLFSVMGTRGGGDAFVLRWQPDRALGLLLTLVGPALFSLPAIRRASADAAWRERLMLGVPALGLPFFAHLVDGNEYKAVFLLLLLLAPFAGAGLLRAARNRAAIAALVLLPFLPGSWLALSQYARERPAGGMPPAAAEALAAAARALPPDLVIWRIDPGSTGYSPHSLPLGRASYLSDPYALQILGQWWSPEALRRRGELEAARAGRIGPALDRAHRAVAPRPLAVGVSAGDRSRYPDLLRHVEDAGARRLLEVPGFELFGLPERPARGREARGSRD